MSEPEIPYVEVISKFSDDTPHGWDYHLLKDYLEKNGMLPEKKPELRVGGLIGSLTQKKLVRLMVYPEVYEKWFGRKPQGGRPKKLYRVYFSMEYKSEIEKLKSLQKEAERQRDMVNKTSLAMNMIEGGRLFTFLQELGAQEDFVEAVLLEEVKIFEENARKKQSEIRRRADEAVEEIEKGILDLYGEYSNVKKALASQRKEINKRRELINNSD